MIILSDFEEFLGFRLSISVSLTELCNWLGDVWWFRFELIEVLFPGILIFCRKFLKEAKLSALIGSVDSILSLGLLFGAELSKSSSKIVSLAVEVFARELTDFG